MTSFLAWPRRAAPLCALAALLPAITTPVAAQVPPSPCVNAAPTAPVCVPTAARRLARGITITAEDIVLRAAEPHTTSTHAVVEPGWITRRVIRAGEPLRPPAVVPPPAVRGGQRVDVMVVRGAVQINVAGVALGEGSPGDTVEVRLESSRRLTGVVTAAGVVTVTATGTHQ